MANHSLPTTSSAYADVISILKARDDDIGTQFQSGLETNQPQYSIKFNRANNNWEEWSGAAWAALTAQYDIDVTSVGGKGAVDFLDLVSTQTKTAGVITLQADVTAPLVIKGGTSDAAFLPFYADSALQNTLSGSIGFDTVANDNLSVRNATSGGNLELSTVGTGLNTSVVDINSNILFDRGHGDASAASDMYLLADGLIAAVNNMNMNITDGASTFFWRTGGETDAATEVMRLESSGNLDVGGVGTFGSISALAAEGGLVELVNPPTATSATSAFGIKAFASIATDGRIRMVGYPQGVLSNIDFFFSSGATIAGITTLGGQTIAGVLTATTFVGALTGAVTGNVAGNLTGNVTGDVTGYATQLKSTSTNVTVSASAAPASGNVLTATSSTNATWQAPAVASVAGKTGVITLVTSDISNFGNYQAAGTYNTTIGTSTNLSTSGDSVVGSITVTDGVITAMATRAVQLSANGLAANSVDTSELVTNSVKTAALDYTTTTQTASATSDTDMVGVIYIPFTTIFTLGYQVSATSSGVKFSGFGYGITTSDGSPSYEGNSTLGTSNRYPEAIFSHGNGSSTTAQLLQTYVQSSPPYDLGDGQIPLFVYALVHRTTGEISRVSVDTSPQWGHELQATTYLKGGKSSHNRRLLSNFLMTVEEAKDSKRLDEYIQTFSMADVEEIEITQKYKNSKKDLHPHPFLQVHTSEREGHFGDYQVVQLNPFCAAMQDFINIREHDDLSLVNQVLHDGYLYIDNLPTKIIGAGEVPVCDFKWKKSFK